MMLAVHVAWLYLALALYFPECAANLPPGVSGPRWPSFFEAPQFHLNIAKKDIEEALKPKDDAPGPRRPTIFEAPEFHLNIAKKDIEAVFKPKENTLSPRWPTIFEAPEFHLNIAIKDTTNAGRNVARGVGEWITRAQEDLETNPVGTLLGAMWDVTKFGVVLVPGLLWGPVLNFLGFGAAGIGQGTIAAAVQSILGPIAPGSVFAFLQSAGAGGYGVATMDLLTRGGLVLKELLGL